MGVLEVIKQAVGKTVAAGVTLGVYAAVNAAAIYITGHPQGWDFQVVALVSAAAFWQKFADEIENELKPKDLTTGAAYRPVAKYLKFF